MIGKPGTSTTALACACYPWPSSSQPFSLENTPQYFGKHITDLFLPSLQRSNLSPCYYACKPKPPFRPLLLLWNLPLGLHSPCQDYYHHHPLRFTSLDHPTSIQLCRNTQSNLPDLHTRSKHRSLYKQGSRSFQMREVTWLASPHPALCPHGMTCCLLLPTASLPEMSSTDPTSHPFKILQILPTQKALGYNCMWQLTWLSDSSSWRIDMSDFISTLKVPSKC